MLATDLLLAGRNLLQHTKRSLFLGSAIAMVTALLVVLNGITNGVRATMLESGTALISGHVNVSGFYKVSAGTSAPILTDYARVLALTRSLPGLDYATARGRGYAKSVSATGSMTLFLGGIDVANEPGLKRVLHPIEGNLDDLKKPNTILLFVDQAKRLNVSVGDDLTLSAPTGRGVNNTADVRVAVVARNVGLLSSFTAFIPNDALRTLYQLKPDTTGAIHVYLKDPEQSARVAALVRDRLTEAGYPVMDPDPSPYLDKLLNKVPSQDWTGQRLDVSTWDNELSFMSWILGAFTGLTDLLIIVLMMVVIVGIMDTMWITIRERTREIGTLRAIGMQRRRVAWLFLLEAGLLGLFGTLTGALTGGLVAAALTALQLEVPEGVQIFLMSQSLSLSVHFPEMLTDIAVVTAVTTLAAFLPALRAARLKPITAMHHIG